MASDALQWVLGLERFGIKLGLHNVTTLLARLGNPERTFHSIHVAGTNGKGSVTAMVDAALQAAGHRSGRYTSPHLVHLSERMVIDGRPVAPGALNEALADVRDAVQQLRREGALQVEPTFFEATTAAAFELFRRAGVGVAVCEVGLGGRLDATNVLTPVVSVITSIGLDHQQYLGHSLPEIAAEKAGIVKPMVPVVVGDLPAEAMQAVAAIARARHAPLVRAHEGVELDVLPGATVTIADGEGIRLRTPLRNYGALRLALAGAHQVANAIVAVRTLEVAHASGVAADVEAIRRGLAGVRWPGRLDLRRLPDGREVLLDAAHNQQGAQALAAYLSRGGTAPPLVFGAMKDKDAGALLEALAPAVSAIICTRASSPRAADPGALAELAKRAAPQLSVAVAESPPQALEHAWRLARRIVVAGSIVLLGDVLQEVGDAGKT